MLFASWEVRIGKNCDRGLEIAAFSRTMLQVFAIEARTSSYFIGA